MITDAQPQQATASVELVVPKNFQNGILKVELGHSLWTRREFIIAYMGLFLTSFVLYLEIYSTFVYFPFVTSAFSSHSMLTTAGIVQNIADVAAYPIIAKLSDVFGRAEGLTLTILFATLSNVLAAVSQNIETYVASNIFEAVGNAGFTIMQQVFIADTTRLINRGIWASLVEAVGVIPVLYIGTIIGEAVLTHSTWRWGYGMWSVVVPIVSVPLIFTVYHHQRRAKKQLGGRKFGVLGDVEESAPLYRKIYHVIWTELDFAGVTLLIAGLALTLIPLSITGAYNTYRWGNPPTIVMMVFGVVCLIGFFFWDARFATKPLFPYRMVKERTVVAASVLAFVDWMGYATSATFLSSYFQVVTGLSPGQAARIDNANRVTFQVASVFVGLLIRSTKRSQPFVLIGVPIAVLSQGLLIYMVNVDGESYANQASFITSRVLSGLGRAFFSTASQVSIQAAVTQQDVAVGTGIFLAAMSVGSSVGRSISGAIWNYYLPQKLEQYLPTESVSELPQIFASFTYAMELPEGSPTRDAINRSYRETTQILAIAATSIMGGMVIIQLFLRNINLEEADLKRQQQLQAVNSLVQGRASLEADPETSTDVRRYQHENDCNSMQDGASQPR